MNIVHTHPSKHRQTSIYWTKNSRDIKSWSWYVCAPTYITGYLACIVARNHIIQHFGVT